MKAIQFKCVAVAGLLLLGLANHSFAVNAAEATGVMADLESLVVQAKATLANAALGGDVDAIAEANKRSEAIDASVTAGREALSGMEQAITAGDADLAQSKEDDLAAALSQARDALAGILPQTAAANANKQSKSNSGGGPGEAGDPPNIYDIPWKSQGIRAYYTSLFGAFNAASSQGQRGFGDREATPE
jgi:hypothetical protein